MGAPAVAADVGYPAVVAGAVIAKPRSCTTFQTDLLPRPVNERASLIFSLREMYPRLKNAWNSEMKVYVAEEAEHCGHYDVILVKIIESFGKPSTTA